jgi:hypothetical protein
MKGLFMKRFLKIKSCFLISALVGVLPITCYAGAQNEQTIKIQIKDVVQLSASNSSPKNAGHTTIQKDDSSKKDTSSKNEDDGGVRFQAKGAAQFNVYGVSAKNRSNITFKKSDEGEVTFSEDEKQRDPLVFSFEKTRIDFQLSDQMDFASFNKWTAYVTLNADRGTIKDYTIVPMAYLQLSSPFCTLILGDHSGAAVQLSYTGNSVLGGSAGFDGNAYKYVGITTGVHVTTKPMGESKESTEILLISQRWNGIQFGVSLTPSTFSVGSLAPSNPPKYNLSGNSFYDKNLLEAGLNYEAFLDTNLQLSLSLTGGFGGTRPYYKADTAGPGLDVYKTRFFSVGGILEWDDFSFAISYTNCLRTGQFKTDLDSVQPEGMDALNYKASEAKAPQYIIVGASYLMGDTKFSLGYFRSWNKTGFNGQQARGNVYNASITYQIQPGVQTFIEGFYHDLKNPSAMYAGQMLAQRAKSDESLPPVIGDQRAKTVLIGIKISF